jgi:hypothetical protein
MEENPDSGYRGTFDLESGEVNKGAEYVQPDNIIEEEVESSDPVVNSGVADAVIEDPIIEKELSVDYLKSWNEKAGTQFQNDDEIVNEIKASKATREKLTEYESKLKEYSDLDDPMIRDIAKAKRAGIGINQYLNALQMEPEKLDAKTALKEDYLLKNADLVATDPEFALMKFERDFKAKFGRIGETLDTSGLDDFEVREKTLEFNREQDFIKRSLQAEANISKKSLSEWKQKYVTIPDVPQQRGMTDEQVQQYFQQADLFVGKNEKIEIPVGDKKFNFGLKDYGETLRQELKNPIDTLKKHGIDLVNGTIDPERLGKLLTAAYVAQNIAKPLSDWSVDARNIESLKAKKVAPAPSQASPSGRR